MIMFGKLLVNLLLQFSYRMSSYISNNCVISRTYRNPAISKNLHEFKLPKVFFAVADPMKIAKGIASKIKDNIEHHVGELEVSHIWYKYPHLIKKDKLTKKGINYEKIFSKYSQYDLFGNSGEVIDIPWNSYEQKAFAPDGSFSDSSKASP